MTPIYKILPTRWNGIIFRSRTEARWAVFLDFLKVPYEYEHQGYDLDGTYYLPDFYLPSLDDYLEVKASSPDKEEQRKAEKLATATRKRVFITTGSPKWNSEEPPGLEAFFPDDGWDHPYQFCICLQCRKIGIEFDGRSARIKCGCHKEGDRTHTADNERLIDAYNAASSERFGT